MIQLSFQREHLKLQFDVSLDSVAHFFMFILQNYYKKVANFDYNSLCITALRLTEQVCSINIV